MSDLTDEARAEIAAAVKILKEDGVHIAKFFERHAKKNPPSNEPPKDQPVKDEPVKDQPTDQPVKDGPTPPPPNPQDNPPTNQPKKVGLWPVGNTDE